MTDGRDYGKVPWEQCEALADNGVTLHTIALNSNEINADVRKKLMKMAKIGGGGFNFCRTVETFHLKVDQLLNMSLAAVCPPTKFSLSLRSGTELIMATLLEHIEQMPSGEELVNPEFTLPAMRRDIEKSSTFEQKLVRHKARVPITASLTISNLRICSRLPTRLTGPSRSHLLRCSKAQ